MSAILHRTVFETCLADQTEAPWEEEVRLILAHDAALRLALEAATRERGEALRTVKALTPAASVMKAQEPTHG